MAKSVSFLDLAVMAIEATQQPMTCSEIIKWGVAKGKFRPKGKTPVNTLHAIMSRSIERDPHSPFVKDNGKFGRGKFGLRLGVRTALR